MLDYPLTLTFMAPSNMQASLGYGVVCVRTSENRARELYQRLFCNDNREVINVKKKKKIQRETARNDAIINQPIDNTKIQSTRTNVQLTALLSNKHASYLCLV